MSFGLQLGLQLGSIGGLSVGITASVSLSPVYLKDGDTIAGTAGIQAMLNIANYDPSADATSIVSATATFTRNSGGDDEAITQSETLEYQDVLTMNLVVTDDAGETLERTIQMYTFYPDPVATTGTLALSYNQNTGEYFVPFTDLFEPATAVQIVDPSAYTYQIASIAGVTLGVSGISIDSAVATVQSTTDLGAVATLDRTEYGVSRFAQVSKPATLDIAANVVAFTNAITLDEAEVWTGDETADQFNFTAVNDPATVTGLTSPSVVVRHPPFGFTGGTNPLTAVPRVPGEPLRIIRDAYEGASSGGDKRFTEELEATIVQLFTATQSGDAASGVLFNPSVVDYASGGPPDAFPVDYFLVDGRSPKASLTIADVRSGETQFVETHEFTTPQINQAGAELAIGDTVTISLPAFLVPDAAVASVSLEKLRGATVLETVDMLALTSNTRTHTLTALDDGEDITWRATLSAPGYTPLVVTSSAASIAYPSAYTQRLYDTQGTWALTLFNLPTANNSLMISAWLDPAAAGRLLHANTSNFRIDHEADDSIDYRIADNAAVRVFDGATAASVIPAGLAHYAYVAKFDEDIGGGDTGLYELYINGVLVANASGGRLGNSTPQTHYTGVMTFFGRSSTQNQLNTEFGDFMIFSGALPTVTSLYNSGTPPDPASLTAGRVCLIGGDLTADDIKNKTAAAIAAIAPNHGDYVLSGTGLVDV